MLRAFCLFIICLLITLPALSLGWSAKLAPVGGVYRMFNRATPLRGQEFEPVLLRLTMQSTDGQQHTINASCQASDIFDVPVAGWTKNNIITVPADKRPVHLDMTLESGGGYFRVIAELTEGEDSQTLMTDVGIIPPSHPGVRPDSFFASNTSGLRTGVELKLLQAIGMKVQRAHFQPEVATTDKEWTTKPATGEALPLDFRRLDSAFTEGKAHGVWVLPIVGYALQGAGAAAKSDNAHKTGMHGPPRDFPEFVNSWEQIVRKYPEIRTYEFWNEPWIFGWTWCDTPASYRLLQTQWANMALAIDPELRIIAGNSSMFTEDHIEHDPTAWKGLLAGTTHHPYGWGTGQANWRDGDQFRSMDYGMQVTLRMGLSYYYLTEGGTQYSTPQPGELLAAQTRLTEIDKQLTALPADAGDPQEEIRQALNLEKTALTARVAAIKTTLPNVFNNLENAAKIVTYNVRQALLGGFQGNAQWGIGYAPEWTKSNTAYAVMTAMLEDRPVVADIWPHHALITGAIFANPSQVTPEVRALPRADELSPRWSVPVPIERQADVTKVAVIWGLTGLDAKRLDQQGTITFNRQPDIRAYDLSGREILPKGTVLSVPLNSNPVYLTTDRLSVVDFSARLADAQIERITPVNVYAQALQQPADLPQSLIVRINSQINSDITGSVMLKIGNNDVGTTAFTIAAGKLIDLAVPWPGIALSPRNQYAVTLTVACTTPGIDAAGKAITRTLPSVTANQLLQSARFVKRTITVDGKLDDWQGTTPVMIDSRLLADGVDPTMYLLNPGIDQPIDNEGNARILARVYTAYDTQYVYLAAAVQEPSLNCTAGTPVEKGRGETKITLPYQNAMPDGLNHVVFAGDVFQFAFGFRDRVPGFGRQMHDPYAWKGMFYDTDDVFVAHLSTDGAQLIRHWGEDTARRNAYQTETVPGYGAIPDGKIRIARDEDAKLTVYELAIPRSELLLFDPAVGQCRFGFRLYNNERLGFSNSLGWSETAGVFDYWRNLGSFTPTWTQHLPCQTVFGIAL